MHIKVENIIGDIKEKIYTNSDTLLLELINKRLTECLISYYDDIDKCYNDLYNSLFNKKILRSVRHIIKEK